MTAMEETCHIKNNDVLDVLKFWHMLEFFNPYDLDEIRSRPNAKYDLTADQLVDSGNQCLPWLSEKALLKAGGSSLCQYRYNLYLLPFNKNELTKMSQRVFPLDKNSTNSFEFEENLDDEGETCFLKFTVDNNGMPDLEKFSISILPWALGRLNQRNLHALNFKCYQDEMLKLKSEISLLASYLANPDSQLITDQIKPNVLTAQGLNALLIILKKWANFSPEHPIALLVEINEIKKRLSSNGKYIENQHEEELQVLKQTQDLSAQNNNNESNVVDEVTNNTTPDCHDILNSFYIEDLERVINDLTENDHHLLNAYITGSSLKKKINLYSQENYPLIIEKLLPQYLNRGRWPTEVGQYMSLMQQFAINECFYPSNEHQIFSVNGPPGTGKTTMFQDIISENIVRRAQVLSSFKTSASTFKNKLTINFPNNDSKTISLLDDKLLGYEMIVASSNNAAVENISKELPLKRNLPKNLQSSCCYLSPVVSKVFAEHKDCRVMNLAEEDEPWGLISVALGNAKNRLQFHERVFFKPEDKDDANERINEGKYLSIWEWRNHYQGPTFQQAKDEFIKIDQEVNAYLDILIRFAELQEKIAHTNIDAICQEHYLKIKLLEEQKILLTKQNEDLVQDLIILQKNKTDVLNTLQQHQLFKPSFIERVMRTQNAKSYKEQLKRLTGDWNTLLKQETQLKENAHKITILLEKTVSEIATIHATINGQKDELQKLLTEYDSLSNLFPSVVLPPSNANIEDKKVQLQAFWVNEKLDALRTHLFIGALKLHEAWLAEVLKNGQFTGNMMSISYLLSNKKPVIKEHEIYLWQSLFMWIPVISTTFASYARQFKNLGPQLLGWLFIDEAGQALPQAAVGAIWRSQRTVVVGDPQQIEPITTIVPNLIEELAKHHLQNNHEKWLPTLASVQTLADDANILGVNIKTSLEQRWIGCPLRIHRRCLDPMFSVANRIAYDNKMINARFSKAIISYNAILNESCWFDIINEATDKQYVSTQGELLLSFLVKSYEDEKQLPKLYIITPFRRIKNNLQKLIGDINNWSGRLMSSSQLPAKALLKEWCSKNIGTIHTFQGKEASIVFFVLGADRKQYGALNWASAKANILNVALTRAKDRIYIIGDYELWSSKNYFKDIAQALPRKVIESVDCALDKDFV